MVIVDSWFGCIGTREGGRKGSRARCQVFQDALPRSGMRVAGVLYESVRG